jgi:predicted RNase H-like HicB family nuclease
MYCAVASYTHFIGRDYEEAMRLAREAIRQHADYAAAHRLLTAAAAMAGHDEVAKGALQALRRVQPDISLGWIARQVPIKQATEQQHYLEALRRAGLN